jgi:hydrogenase maturation protein HypF
VQGVGFRPFVWNLAHRLSLAGSVCNTSGAVVIEVEGDAHALSSFVSLLRAEAPRLARIDSVDDVEMELTGAEGFHIVQSRTVAGEYQPIAPDAAACADCLRELMDPADHRHRYPFINCTNCGPRFTIIEDVPYDRALTTMRGFAMCERCRREYEDPADRRFHAQPNACPDCGPRLWLAGADGRECAGDAVELAAAAVGHGEVIAVKGLGGFQLCCDAGDDQAVRRLRGRKHRGSKPFAVMCADLDAVRTLCDVSAAEAAILEGSVRPIVLLRLHDGAAVAPSVAPGLHELGVMLPCTPLHHLLLRSAARPLVMTSGNLSEEPIAKGNDEALVRLRDVADRYLLHDRDIYARYDDSVVRVVGGRERMIRRARGYCPLPLRVNHPSPPALAVGAHLKNTFCVVKEGSAFVGPHIGDLDTPLSLEQQAESLETYLRLFRATPALVVADLHPDYASTRLAERWWDDGAREVRVQHHHAHVASVMAEHALHGPVIGVAFDGVGLGPDGTIWGGEFLVCDERGFLRAGHLRPVRQPGGDACARQGWRMAAAYLVAAGSTRDVPPQVVRDSDGAPGGLRWRQVARLAAGTTGAPLSTSAGRLFDAVASLLGVAQESSFEAEAAMRLEAVASGQGLDGVRPIEVRSRGEPLVLDTVTLVRSLADERQRGRPAGELAAVFHASLARAIALACAELSRRHSIRRVALSGGVFQNGLLLRSAEGMLRERGLDVYSNERVPANDGGISLGQALVAAASVSVGAQ